MYLNTLKKNRTLRSLALRFRYWREKGSFNSGNNKVISHGVKTASRIQVKGSANVVEIAKDAVLYGSLIKVNGKNNRIILHEGAYLRGAELYVEDNNCTIEIGANTYIGHHSHFACTEDGSTLKVGSNCMISSYVQVRTGDSHSILDMEGNRINPAADVYIGDHCWLGEGCHIMKGVILERDSIVSTGAIVTKSAGPNVLLGGVPAKVIKENVNWDENRM